MALSTVVLDLDGVIRHFDPQHVASIEAKHHLPAGVLTKTAFEPNLLNTVITGLISRAQWCDEVGRRAGNIEAAAEWMADSGSVDKTMLAEVDALRSRGVVVAVLTNGTNTIAQEMDHLGLNIRFDVMFNSAEIGFAKPDPRAFEHVCRELGIEPSAAFFTDDSRPNLRGAVEVGMTARLFEGIEVFRRHLTEVGLTPS